MTVYYYIYQGIKFGSINNYKIECLSKRDSDGVVYKIVVDYAALFGGVFLNAEWLG
jgi:hypothetical protein